MQAERFGADIRDGVVTAVDLSKKPYTVTIDDGTQIAADTIIVATGASAKYLGLPDEQKYNGQGVSACATCDGFFYRKKVVAVVGGGDTACEEATYLASLAAKVYMIVRKPYLRATTAERASIKYKQVEFMGYHPEQVQDFIPTPGTLSTCMWYTGLNPLTGQQVYSAKSHEEKAMQRALMQFWLPDNYDLVRKALEKAGRCDLIGYGHI